MGSSRLILGLLLSFQIANDKSAVLRYIREFVDVFR